MSVSQLSVLQQNVKDRVGNPQASTSQLNLALNRAYQWLYNKLSNLYGADYFVTQSSLAVVSGTQAYDLPADFYKLIRLEDDNKIPVQKLNVREATLFTGQQNLAGVPNVAVGYMLYGFNASTGRQQLYLAPAPSSNATWTLWYNYVPTQLSAATDTPLLPETYEEVLELYATGICHEILQNFPASSYYINRSADKLKEMINDLKDRDATSNPRVNRQYYTRADDTFLS